MPAEIGSQYPQQQSLEVGAILARIDPFSPHGRHLISGSGGNDFTTVVWECGDSWAISIAWRDHMFIEAARAVAN